MEENILSGLQLTSIYDGANTPCSRGMKGNEVVESVLNAKI